MRPLFFFLFFPQTFGRLRRDENYVQLTQRTTMATPSETPSSYLLVRPGVALRSRVNGAFATPLIDRHGVRRAGRRGVLRPRAPCGVARCRRGLLAVGAPFPRRPGAVGVVVGDRSGRSRCCCWGRHKQLLPRVFKNGASPSIQGAPNKLATPPGTADHSIHHLYAILPSPLSTATCLVLPFSALGPTEPEHRKWGHRGVFVFSTYSRVIFVWPQSVAPRETTRLRYQTESSGSGDVCAPLVIFLSWTLT